MLLLFALLEHGCSLDDLGDVLEASLSGEWVVEGFRLGSDGRWLHVALAPCSETSLESVWRSIVVLILRGLEMRRAVVVDVEELKVLDVDLQLNVPRIEIRCDPLLSVRYVRFAAIPDARISNTFLSIAKTLTQACRIRSMRMGKIYELELSLPKDPQTRTACVKTIRNLQYQRIRERLPPALRARDVQSKNLNKELMQLLLKLLEV